MAAVLLAVGGIVPAMLWLAAGGAVYVARSPDRLLDMGVVVAFCVMDYLLG